MWRWCARASGAASWVALISSGCLQDLPEPLSCPPEPVVVSGIDNATCAQRLVTDAGNDLSIYYECAFQPAYTGCYRPNDPCDCNKGECPEPDAMCYPEEDCPVLVEQSYGEEDATCLRLHPDDLSNELEGPAGQCLCGCRSCAIQCDGRGAMWSLIQAFDQDMNRYGPAGGIILWDIERDMPDQGRVGFYVRARGTSGFLVGGSIGLYAADTWAAVLEAVAMGIEAPPVDYGEQLLRDWNDDFSEELYPKLRSEAYSWEDAGRRPKMLIIYPGVSGTLLEIDCLFPVVF